MLKNLWLCLPLFLINPVAVAQEAGQPIYSGLKLMQVQAQHQFDPSSGGPVEEIYYTHAMWRVQPGREQEFISSWNHLSNVFSSLDNKPKWGSLLQSLDDPCLFYSFGPWSRLGDIVLMRAHPDAQKALTAIRALCVEATPAAYRLVSHVEVDE